MLDNTAWLLRHDMCVKAQRLLDKLIYSKIESVGLAVAAPDAALDNEVFQLCSDLQHLGNVLSRITPTRLLIICKSPQEYFLGTYGGSQLFLQPHRSFRAPRAYTAHHFPL